MFQDLEVPQLRGRRPARCILDRIQQIASGFGLVWRSLIDLPDLIFSLHGSSRKNTVAILHAAAMNDHFDACVDGIDAEALKLPGKPDPALFLEIARRLGVQPLRAIVFALAGVEAGKRAILDAWSALVAGGKV